MDKNTEVIKEIIMKDASYGNILTIVLFVIIVLLVIYIIIIKFINGAKNSINNVGKKVNEVAGNVKNEADNIINKKSIETDAVLVEIRKINKLEVLEMKVKGIVDYIQGKAIFKDQFYMVYKGIITAKIDLSKIKFNEIDNEIKIILPEVEFDTKVEGKPEFKNISKSILPKDNKIQAEEARLYAEAEMKKNAEFGTLSELSKKNAQLVITTIMSASGINKRIKYISGGNPENYLLK